MIIALNYTIILVFVRNITSILCLTTRKYMSLKDLSEIYSLRVFFSCWRLKLIS